MPEAAATPGTVTNCSLRSQSTSTKRRNNIENEDEKFVRAPKLPLYVVNRRLSKLKTYIGEKKNIRHSPFRLNLVCQFAARGDTVVETLQQLKFLNKIKAPLVAEVVQKTAKSADLRDQILPTRLEVAECFATNGRILKRLKITGRGRSGIKKHRHSNVRLVLREIDFDLKLVQAKSHNEYKKWQRLRDLADAADAEIYSEREELRELEEAVAKAQEARDAKKKT